MNKYIESNILFTVLKPRAEGHRGEGTEVVSDQIMPTHSPSTVSVCARVNERTKKCQIASWEHKDVGC